MKTVAIAGTNAEYAMALMQNLTGFGYEAAGDGEALDMFMYIADAAECGKTAYDTLLRGYETVALGLLEAVAAALPRLEQGTEKRLCFVNKLSSSVYLSGETGGGYERTILAASNKAVRMLFNRLRPAGYTFRLYGVNDYRDAGECSYIAEYCARNRSFDPKEPLHCDDNRLMLRGKREREYPW